MLLSIIKFDVVNFVQTEMSRRSQNDMRSDRLSCQMLWFYQSKRIFCTAREVIRVRYFFTVGLLFSYFFLPYTFTLARESGNHLN